MKYTRAIVEKEAKERGWEPIQIDGTPEGFAWKESDLTVGETTFKGRTIKINPIKETVTYE